ncbi:cytoplasmic protein [Shewanella sp. SNU WT4]|uniref:cytoplasmic protein n=1 Tax=Shewanella sp. SNU WT4 TaxID=2590015 RepID=UPI00112B9CBF|nr:cytoplasmic protein [Shewanella sp. SNU WT4]QDF66114.1 cytoplasmic protein [Shewanella sp. SNU WT4]
MADISSISQNNTVAHISKVAQMGKEQQQAEGKIIMDLIAAADAPAPSPPSASVGQNINTRA